MHEQTLHERLLKMRQRPSVKIADKRKKLSLLERLELIVCDDMAATLAAIRRDIEQFESE